VQAHLNLVVEAGAIGHVESFVTAFAARHGLGNDDRSRAAIVLEELITNLIKYGYQNRAVAGAAEVGLLLEEGRLTLELIDDGCAFDPFAAAEPDLSRPLEARLPGGLGLQIVRLLTESRHYNRVNGRNVMRLTLAVSHPPAFSKKPPA
jgi:anti-sigma regulatory factor (Ser/Thr protein kinase)